MLDKITVQFISRLPQELIAQFCQSSLSFWGGKRTQEEYLQRNLTQLSRGAGLLKFSGVTNDAGQLLASLKRYTLTLHHPQKNNLPAIGIGAVFTKEDARTKGAASELLQKTLEEAKQEGFAAALLFSDIPPAFYERLGFVSYPSLDRSFLVGLDQAGESLTTRSITPADEAFCYQNSLQSRSVDIAHMAPSFAEWRFFRWRNAQNPCLILQQNQVDVGHVILEVDGDTLWVEEWAAPGISEELMFSTLQQMASSQGLKKVCGWFPEKTKAALKDEHRPIAIPMLYFFERELVPTDASFWSIEHF